MKRGLALFVATAFVLASGCLQPAEESMNATEEPVLINRDGITGGSQSGPLVPCPETQRRMTVEDCDDLKAALGDANAGTAAFNVPSELVVARPVTIQLAISRVPPIAPSDGMENASNAIEGVDEPATDPNATEADAASPVDPPDPSPVPAPQRPENVVDPLPGTTETYSPVTGKFMVARLVGEGFTIEDLSPAEQELSKYGVTTWEWKVTAVKKGPHTLTLKTAVQGVTADGSRYILAPTVRNQPIEVRMTWWQSVVAFVEGMPAILKILTAAVVALTALATAVWALRRAVSGQAPEMPDEAPPES